MGEIATSANVSILCTTYNASDHVAQAIQSVLGQTIGDWHLVIVDDGSSDNTRQVIRSLVGADSRVTVVEGLHRGRGAALATAVEHAPEARYICVIDADDAWHPRKLEVQLTRMRRSSWAVLGTQVVVGPRLPLWSADHLRTGRSEEVTDSLRLRNPLCHSSMMVRGDAFRAVGGYSVERSGQFDYDLYRRIAKAGGSLGIVDAAVTFKRIHRGQAFERRRHFRYALGSVGVQIAAARDAHDFGRISRRDLLASYMFAGIRLMWSATPRALRVGRLRRWVRNG